LATSERSAVSNAAAWPVEAGERSTVNDDALSRIIGWCEADPSLTFAPEGPEVEVAGDPPLHLALTITAEEILLTHRMAITGVGEPGAASARGLLNKRGSLLHGTATVEGDRVEIAIENPIYLDGLNRQNFLLAVHEVAGAADSVAALGPRVPEPAAAVALETATPVVAPVVLPEEAAAAAPTVAAPLMVPEPLIPVVASPIPQPVAGVADTIEMPVRAAQAAAWVPTHEVPTGGMSAWPRPDPQLAPIARLTDRVQLTIDETRGAWARVTGSNGWTGWVDARRLLPLGGAPQAQPVVAQPVAFQPVIPQPVVPQQVYAPSWQATHEVPRGGMSAWAQPDPQFPPVTQLSERVRLRVEETRGAWSRVSAENGWSGWVDGRLLRSAGAVGAAAGASSATQFGSMVLRPLPLVGGIAVIIATFLNWMQMGSSNGFNVGLPFLWGGWEHGGDGPDLGIFTLTVGIGALLLAILPRTSLPLLRALGSISVVIAVVFAIQVMLMAGDLGGNALDAFSDGMSFGPYLTLAGGLLMLATKKA
jgi:SH3-like domain-containing protein